MIDTHAHLVHEDFEADWTDVVRRAREAGVEKILNVGFDLASSRRAVEQAERCEGVYATVGVHPHDAVKWDASTRSQLLDLASHPKVVAVGETGLDFHYDFSPRSVQEEVFRATLRLSLETGLPLVIHNREADDVTLQIVQEEGKGKLGGVFHCFTSDEAFAQRCLEAGFYLGFTGIVTYRKSEPLRQVVRTAPHSRMLIETDCPYLAPQRFRGRRNEPAFVVEVAEKIAEVRGVDVGTVVEATNNNAAELFLFP